MATLSSSPPPRVIGKRPRMSRFLRVLLTITAVVHVPFVFGVAEALERYAVLPSRTAWSIAAVLGVLGVVFFVGRAKTIMNDEHRPWWRTFLVDVPYYAHWTACLWCLVPSLVYVIGAPLVDLARGQPVHLAHGFFMWTYASGIVVCSYGVTLRRWMFQVKRVDVPVKDLPAELEGTTIAHLSDLHIGAMTPLWWAKRWTRAANAKKPDFVVITGDMVTSGVAFHEDIAELVSTLEAPVFVSMGNHDYFGEGEPLISLLRTKGRATVLRNEGQVVTRNGKELFLAAIDDTWTRRADMDRALEERPEGMPTILLAHDPDKFPSARDRKVDVVLSGHTHGGQIALPFIARHVNFSKLAHRYHLGVYTEGDASLYVHPGLGTTGPPIRLGVAPAVALVTLRRA
jgi:predicted MPP superfamily phosphohydrolase